jgi:hypothetical protein
MTHQDAISWLVPTGRESGERRQLRYPVCRMGR